METVYHFVLFVPVWLIFPGVLTLLVKKFLVICSFERLSISLHNVLDKDTVPSLFWTGKKYTVYGLVYHSCADIIESRCSWEQGTTRCCHHWYLQIYNDTTDVSAESVFDRWMEKANDFLIRGHIINVWSLSYFKVTMKKWMLFEFLASEGSPRVVSMCHMLFHLY